LQAAKKKRTDRSYLSGVTRPAEADTAPDDDMVEAPAAESSAAPAEEVITPEPVQPVAAPASRTATSQGRLPGSVRALQQQGVRRRRELDVEALAVRDSQYAVHELRRILILATMVFVTLVVLGIVLR
jgi:hypothetical protein